MFTSREFSITEEEWNKIKEWDNTHKCIYKPKYGIKKYCGAVGGNLSITFIPTSIGEIVRVDCGCGEHIYIREL
jgi:hypothetical protein